MSVPESPKRGAASISVIVVTRDRPRLLEDAIASIARQTLAPLEVRIGDDGNVSAIEALEDFPGLQVTVIPSDAGQAGATRNLAAAEARGDVLAFLDDDDRWLPLHLASLSSAFERAETQLAFTDSRIVRERIDREGVRHDLESRTITRDWDPELMRHNAFVAPSALALRRDLFERLGGFDPEFRFSEDWDLLLRAARLTTPVRVAGVTAEVRLRESGNASADFGEERLDCLARLAERHELPGLEPRTFWEVAAIAGARA
jgi:glycosyltransferase involved in cell wall biosynthesis